MMFTFRDLPISKKILLCFLPIAILIGAAGVVSVILIESKAEELAGFHLEALHKIQSIDAGIKEAIEESLAYVVSGDVSEKEDFLKYARRFEHDATEFRKIARLDQPGEEKERKIFRSIVTQFNTLYQSATTMFNEFEKTGSVSYESFQVYEAAVDQLTDTVEHLVQIESKEVERALQDPLAVIDSAQVALWIIGAGGFILALTLGCLLSRSITRPITRLRDTALEVSKGRLDIQLGIKSRDEIGELTSSFNRMITELKRIQELLLREKDMGEKIVNHVGAYVMLLDRDFRIIKVSKFLLATLELEEKDVIGNFCYKVTHHLDEPCKPPGARCPIRHVLKTGRPISLEYTYFDRYKKQRDVEVSVYPVRDEKGKITQFVHLGIDITEKKHMIDKLKKINENLKQTQAQLIHAEKLATVGQMSAGVAHELNSPLQAIMGTIELMLRDKHPEAVRSDLELLLKESQRCQRIILDMLKFARPSHAKTTPTRINQLLEEVIKSQRHRATLHGITIYQDLEQDLSPIQAKPQDLEQVFLNIITNAFDAIGKRKDGKLWITTRREDTWVHISFKDNGPGIAPEHMDKIFEPFFTTREVGKGTGLGLSLCHFIIQAHVGQIWAESKPGEGATFHIKLPLIRPPVE
jgi:PAS domain S-box-containing protein